MITAACGSDDDSTATTPETTVVSAETAATTDSIATTEAPATTEEPETSDAPTATADSTTDSTADSTSETTVDPDACRDVVHVLGTACVPLVAQRIVVLDSLLALPTLLDADAPVVGAVSVYDVGDPFPTFVDPAKAAGIETVGSLQTPNIEKIAALEPDLIIGASIVMEPLLAQLEAIAPSVATNYAFYTPDWRDDVRLVGEAAGVSESVEESLTELGDRITELNMQLTGGGDGPTLSRVDVFSGQLLYYRYNCSAFGEVLLSVGIRQPEAQRGQCTPNDYASVLVYPSLEEVEVFDADVIVAYQQQAGAADVGADPLAFIATSPLWGTLPAVQSGDVHVVGDAWGLGVSVAAFQLMLDDVESYFS